MLFLSAISRYLPEIFAAIAITTAFLVPIAQQSKKPNKNLLNTLIASFALCILLFIAKVGFDRNYSYVPDVVGCTYDEAILRLQDAGYRPRFILTGTNDLSSVSCRVSWQSLSANSVTNKGCLCILILDDNYQADTMLAIEPFHQYVNHFVYLSYEFNQNGFPVGQIIYSIVPLSGSELMSIGTRITVLEDKENDYASTLLQNSFAEDLSDAAIMYLKLGQNLSPIYTVAEFDDASLFGKLLLENEVNESYEFCNVTTEEYDWLILLPKNIVAGNHQFVGSIVTANGENFEFTIPVIIEE